MSFINVGRADADRSADQLQEDETEGQTQGLHYIYNVVSVFSPNIT
jgi:hypothetical protein